MANCNHMYVGPATSNLRLRTADFVLEGRPDQEMSVVII